MSKKKADDKKDEKQHIAVVNDKSLAFLKNILTILAYRF